jgi:hypothetical protein
MRQGGYEGGMDGEDGVGLLHHSRPGVSNWLRGSYWLSSNEPCFEPMPY